MILPDVRPGYDVRLLLIFVLAALLGSGPPAAPRAASVINTPMTRDGFVQIVLELDDQPSTLLPAEARGTSPEQAHRVSKEHTAKLDQDQRRLLPALARLGGTVLYRTQRTYNGIGLLLPVEHVTTLAALPGVRAVHPAVLHQLAYSSNLHEVAAPAAWTAAPGGTGAGQKIAIVDTGIDYTHADFGGAGTPAASDAARANSREVEPGTGFPNAKVAGGIDLVGDDYDAQGDADQATPRPDPDPVDCYGHGTHVAGIAAGLGVTEEGTTYRGPYSTDGPSPALRISPGVAPGASLYAVKIFGCHGVTAVTPAALEWAIDPNGDGDFTDRMDVINLSLGSPFGSAYDSSAVAAENAARAGIVVVTSAGNQSDTYYATSSPGTSDRAIAVAASQGEDISSFSSRGPRRGDNALKPDIAAPGSGIYSARHNSGAGGITISGTSMASPHVAGAAALLRERRPGWSVEELKAALLNTAGPRLHTTAGTTYSPVRAGAGRLNIGRAIRTTAVAYSADDPGRVSITWGAPEVIDALSLVKNLRVVNKSLDGPPITYKLSITKVLAASGVSVTPGLRSITVGPGESATVPILLSIPDGQALGRSHDPALTPGTQPRHDLNEVAGSITLTPTAPGYERLEVGYFAAPRRAALRTATPHSPSLPDGDGVTTLHLSGSSAADPPFTSFFELQHSSPLTGTPEVETGGVLALGQAADLQYVGVTSDFSRVRDIAQSTVAFGIATYAPWTTPAEVSFEIEIDRDQNGTVDYTLLTTDPGPGDIFMVRLRSASGVEQVAGRVNFVEPNVDTAIYGSRVLSFGVRAELLDLTAANSRFNYRVHTYHLDVYDRSFNQTLVDQTPTLSYDPAQPGVAVLGSAPVMTGAPIFAAGAATINLSYSTSALAANGTRGVLLLHHNNIVEQQPQVVPIMVAQGQSYHVYLPAVARGAP